MGAASQSAPAGRAQLLRAVDRRRRLRCSHNASPRYELAPEFTAGATIEYDREKAFSGADFIYAKNWSAYADPDYGKILSTDRSWTVDTRSMALTDNAFFMHCLPVRRNMIVTDDVIESERSLVIPEAANREISAQTVLKRMLQSL